MRMFREFIRSLRPAHAYAARSALSPYLISPWQPRRQYSATSNDLPADANVVIIGGGAAGTSIAYHLAKQGCQDVLLLEMAELTAGSTWHAAGLVTSFNSSGNVKRIQKYSLDLFSQLEQETGQAINFHNSGSLRLVTSEERAEELRYQVSRNRTKGNPAQLLTPDEIVKCCPLLIKDKIKLGLYTYDGHLDPYSLTQAYAKGARKNGARIHQQTRVTGLARRSQGGWRVDTNRGAVNADKVVNAAGFHAKDVAALSGYNLPLVAVEHQYIVTTSIPEVQKLKKEIPVVRYLDASSYIRMERGGLLVGVFEAPHLMKLKDTWLKDGVGEEFSKKLFEDDLERSESYLSQVMDIIPCLRSAQIQSVVNGPITYTADGLPMVGPHTLPDMWLAVGLGSGIVLSGGVGKYLSDYILTGEPPSELIEFDPGRFQDSWVTDDYLLAKAREAYGNNYLTSYPHDEHLAGRPSRRVSSAVPQQKKRGARFMPHAGWEQPAWFAGEGNTPEFKPAFSRTNWHSTAVRESEAVMHTAGIIDLTPFGKFAVKGEQAAEFLSRVTANSLPREGRCVVTHCLTSRGSIYAQLTISRTASDSFLVVTGSGSEIHDLRWLQQKADNWGYINVTFINMTEDLGCLSVAGPNARAILRAASNNFPEKFPYLSLRNVTVGDLSVDCIHFSYTGEEGWELYHPRDQTGRLYEMLLDAGKPFALQDFGTHALNMLRLEKGFRGWGTEMNVDTTMAAAGMTSFIDWKKGDFEGRAAAEQHARQVPERLLVQVSLDCPTLDPMGSEAVWANGAMVGSTTSGCFSPVLGKSLAFCYLPPLLTVPGTEVQVEILNKFIPATVLSKPPMETHYTRSRKNKQ